MDPAEFRAIAREDARQQYEDGRIDEHQLAASLTTFADPPETSATADDADCM